AEATIYGFTAALMVPVLGWLILKEPISRLAVLATLIGFFGAVITAGTGDVVSTPGSNRTLGLIAVFAAAFLYAMVLILLRMRARSEDALTIAMFTNTVPAIIMLPVLLGLFGFPNWTDLPSFALLGVLGFCVWYLMTLGYARAPAQRLAPIEYTAIVWSSLLGALFFAEVPGWNLYAGGTVIIVACLMVAYEDHQSKRRDANAETSDASV
ncbi:MAG: DMT family transporter, partial [Pseudomonadota bacterium]